MLSKGEAVEDVGEAVVLEVQGAGGLAKTGAEGVQVGLGPGLQPAEAVVALRGDEGKPDTGDLAEGQLAMSRQAFAQATDKAWKNPRYFAAYGESLLAQADYRQAIEAFTKGLNANPDHLRSKLGLALARIYREDRVKDAADAINEALSLGDALTPGMKARALAPSARPSLWIT